MVSKAAMARTEALRQAVPALKYIAELQHCRGFVPDNALEAVRQLEGAPLAVFVTAMCDNLEFIDDTATILIVGRVREHVKAYVASGIFTFQDYVEACDAFEGEYVET